ncbi:MAG: 50S ribosomal protein L6 [Firmicutes bacterium]|nr:50S ribosomal protein L6 [Bacillota bacterium]
MSRIGRLPVEIPAGVEVQLDEKENKVTVKGPKGTLTRTFSPAMTLKQENGHISVIRPNDEKENKALHGLTRALLHNMVVGVTTGFEKVLEINGVGYRAAKQGNVLNLTLGYSHPVNMEDPEGVETEVQNQTTIIVRGIDKEKVGQHAANIRFKRPPEPYKGKGIKYKEETIRRKVGKTGK